ncbi:MAG: hypothetical protein CV090_15865, partial [Nitrospira sp. WS238]|nr:hypothetical protein [Nitrospira sp. WS238]
HTTVQHMIGNLASSQAGTSRHGPLLRQPPSSVKKRLPTPFLVPILRLVNLLADGCELMANRRHLTRGII